MDGQNYFEIPEEVTELRQQNANYAVANETLTKDYQARGQEIAFLKAQITQSNRERDEAQKQLNDLIIHTNNKLDQVKNIIVEIPHKMLYDLALDWQSHDESIFVTVSEDGEVNLRTREEMREIKKQAEDPNWHPPYRHWWNVKVV